MGYNGGFRDLMLSLVAILFALLTPAAASAADTASTRHLTVTASPDVVRASPLAPATLLVDIAPNPGIQVYAPGARDFQPVAMKLDLPRGMRLRRLKYPKSDRMSFGGERVPVYGKPFRLVGEVSVEPSLRGQTLSITGTIEYQACDDTICFKPASVPVSWTIDIR